MAAVCLLAIYCCGWIGERPSRRSEVCGAYVGASAILQNMFLTFLLPESLKLAELLGQGPSFAGVVSALAFLGTAFGSFVALTGKSDFASCTATVNVLNFGVLASAGAFALASQESEVAGALVGARSRDALLLLISRLVGGTVVGIFYVSSHPIFLDLGTVSERFLRASRLTVYFLTGLGVGPMLVPIAKMLGPEISSSCYLVTSMFAWHLLVGLVLSFLNCGQRRSWSDSAQDSQGVPGALPENFHRVIIGSLMVESTRCFVVGGLEIGNATILERLMCWDAETTGTVIGIPILMTPVFLWLVSHLRGEYSTTVLIRVLLVQALLSSLATFNIHRGFHGFGMAADGMKCAAHAPAWQGGGGVLLAGNSVMFPTSSAAQALVMGIMFQSAAAPGQSTFDVRGCAFWATMIGAISKFLGQWVTPSIIALGGQNLFALSQVVLLLMFLLVSETLLHTPALHEPKSIEDNEGSLWANMSPEAHKEHVAKDMMS